MRPLRYSINVTLDGCVDHRVGAVDAELHNHHADNLARADALIFGRVTYEMMLVWRDVARGDRPDWVVDWMVPFAEVIDAAKKYVVSDSLETVDWNAELIRGADLERTVRQLKQQPGRGLALGGVTLPLALAGMGLIDEYEFVVQPRLAGHGPYLFAGLSTMIDLQQVDRREFGSGAVATRYEAKPQSR
jgi:dihydrofolate reductase